jgi:hypothetical protein
MLMRISIWCKILSKATYWMFLGPLGYYEIRMVTKIHPVLRPWPAFMQDDARKGYLICQIKETAMQVLQVGRRMLKLLTFNLVDVFILFINLKILYIKYYILSRILIVSLLFTANVMSICS